MNLHKLHGFVQIVKESIKIRNTNGKIFTYIFSFSFVIYSFFYFLNISSIKPLISDLLLKLMNLSSTTPSNPNYFSLLLGIEKDSGLFLVVEIIYFSAYLSVFLVSISATILVSSSYYTGKVFSNREVVLEAIKSFKRPFVTYIFIKLMSLGYMFLSILVIIVPQLLFSNYPFASRSILIFFSILASILYLQFWVVWLLGIVVSVMEQDCYGIEALGKAGRIIKGKRIDGFLINLGLNLILLVLYGFLRYIIVKPDIVNNHQTIMGIYMVFCTCLVQLFQFLAYTVLYFECKKNHGEDIGENSQLPIIPLLD